MKALLLLALALPTSGQAWEFINPASPPNGAVTTTTITDILTIQQADWFQDRAPSEGHWVAFADAAVVETCRAMGRFGPEIPDSAFVYGGRYILLETFINGGQRLLPTALFALAHGMRVRVKISFSGLCRVQWLQTCTGPNSCVAP